MYHDVLFVGRRRAARAAVFTLCMFLAPGFARAADPVAKCQVAISAAQQKYAAARAKLLAKCETAKDKGKIDSALACGEPSPNGDAKTYAGILKAQNKLNTVVAKACGTQPLASIGWAGRVPACDFGERDGLACQSNSDCPGVCDAGQRQGQGVQCPSTGTVTSNCPSVCDGTCVAGANGGQLCTADVNCPGSTCGSMTCKGGTNNGGTCTSTANCPGNNTCTKSNGCGANSKTATVCPDIESDGCNGSLANESDVASCLSCASNTAVDQLSDLLFGSVNPPDVPANAALEKCKQAVVKSGAKFFAAKSKLLAACEKAAISTGAGAGACPDTVKAAPKIQAAKDKMLAAIAKACGGADKAFGGAGANADFTAAQIGAPLSCPNVTIPGGANCYAFIETAQDLANCVYCVSEFKADVLNALAAPANGPYPPEANPLCGNGKLETGENCDDGNNADGDGCPANCVIGSCAVPTGTTTVTLTLTPPAGQDVSALAVYLDYPDAGSPNVRIPGSGNSAQVQARITPDDGNTNFTANDVDFAIRILLQSNDLSPINPTTIQVQFDRCGAAPPLPQYKCRVESATGPTPGLVPVNGVACTLS